MSSFPSSLASMLTAVPLRMRPVPVLSAAASENADANTRAHYAHTGSGIATDA